MSTSATTQVTGNVVEVITRGPKGPIGDGSLNERTFNQTSHNFSVFQLVYFSESNQQWQLAIADPTHASADDGADSADVVGMVSAVPSDDVFTIVTGKGFFDSVGAWAAVDVGKKTYLSETTPGGSQMTRPTFPNFVKTIFQIISTDTVFVDLDTAVQGAP